MSAARLALLSKVLDVEKTFSSDGVPIKLLGVDVVDNNEDGVDDKQRRSRRSSDDVQGFDDDGGKEHCEVQCQQQHWEQPPRTATPRP